MSTGSKTELSLIFILGLGLRIGAPKLPDQIETGILLLFCSALLLLQGMVRDLFLLAGTRTTASPVQQKKVRCLCLESIYGIFGIVLGTVLLRADFGTPIEMTRWCWSL